MDVSGFAEASETLLLVAPEYQALRVLVLDYFDSIRKNLREDHVIFQFDQSMSCSVGDCTFIEQLGLSIGVDAAKREAALLITGAVGGRSGNATETPIIVCLFVQFVLYVITCQYVSSLSLDTGAFLL